MPAVCPYCHDQGACPYCGMPRTDPEERLT